MFILLVNQIHNLHKQLKLYIFQGPSDSLYKLCKTFNSLFSVSCTSTSFEGFPQCIPLSDVLTLISNWISLLSPTLNHYNHFKFNSELQGNFCTSNFKEVLEPEVTIISNIKLLNTVLLLEIFIDYHSNDVPVKVLKFQ